MLKHCTKLALTLGLLLSTKSQAIPLFGEAEGVVNAGILSLYKDHQDPNKFYFFPNSTQLSKDNSGAPLFNFVYWGLGGANPMPGSPQPGAYLSLSTHLANDAAQQKALNEYIKQNPNAKVAVLPIKSSIIVLKTTAKDQPPMLDLFKELTLPPHGSDAAGEIGINAVLTPVGAHAFKALLKRETAGSAFNLQYCYTIQGYGPNMNATISVDMRRIYDYFEANHSGGWGWASWEIKTVVEKLKENHAINITMNGGDAKQWEVLEKVATEITRRLFQPELSATPASVSGGNNLFRFGVGVVHKEELKNETWTWVRRDLDEHNFCTAIALKDLAGYEDKLIVNADE